MAQYIPDEHYVGIRYSKTPVKNPLAFMTPYGTDSAAKKRMGTVDNWCGTKGIKKKIDNNSMRGFSIGDEVRRWSTSNVVWRINDPRGFQLEISSGNMAYIMTNSIINKGVIEEDMQWVRDGPDNYLLPVSSEQYKKYNSNTNIVQMGLKAKDLTVGDYVQCLTGEKGIYLGMYSMVSYRENGKIMKVNRRHVIRENCGSYTFKSSWKPFGILEAGKAENKDYSDEMNKNIDKIYNVFYICQGKFDVGKALQSVKRVPWIFDTTPNAYQYSYKKTINSFLFEYDGMILSGSVHAYSGRVSWSNQCMIQKLNFNDNGHNESSEYNFSGGSRLYSYGKKDIKYVNAPNTCKDSVDKFNYSVTIDGKDYVMRK